MGQRVLECVRELRKDAGFIDELRCPQAVEPTTEFLARQLGDRLEECNRHTLADGGGNL